MFSDIYSDGPLMVGHPTNDLKPGNQLRFTCSFRKSRPKPILSWFVDSQEVRHLNVDSLIVFYLMYPNSFSLSVAMTTNTSWLVKTSDVVNELVKQIDALYRKAENKKWWTR